MTEHDVLVGFRLRLFTLAEELGNVSEACRLMGVDRSTYYRLKVKVCVLASACRPSGRRGSPRPMV